MSLRGKNESITMGYKPTCRIDNEPQHKICQTIKPCTTSLFSKWIYCACLFHAKFNVEFMSKKSNRAQNPSVAEPVDLGGLTGGLDFSAEGPEHGRWSVSVPSTHHGLNFEQITIKCLGMICFMIQCQLHCGKTIVSASYHTISWTY